MWLVVGLGNPGASYQGTRHNIGFDVVQRLAKQHRCSGPKEQASALVWRGSIGGRDVLLAAPQTYMNLSGDAVGALLRYYKIDPAELVVVHDELDFPPGQVRIKLGGGHAGHKGMQSVMAQVGREFVRVRVGIGKPLRKEAGADHVLSRFDKATRKLIEGAVAQAAQAVEVVLAEGAEPAMNRFNGV